MHQVANTAGADSVAVVFARTSERWTLPPARCSVLHGLPRLSSGGL